MPSPGGKPPRWTSGGKLESLRLVTAEQVSSQAICVQKTASFESRVGSDKVRRVIPNASRLAGRILLLSLWGALFGCGRPATETECREILRKSAELELRARLGQETELIEKEVVAIEASMRDAMMKQCVGKRITSSALSCIRSAKTTEELLDECL